MLRVLLLLLAVAIMVVVGFRFTGAQEVAQTGTGEWRELLQQLSDLAIADNEIRKRLTPQQIDKRWLGEPPASEEQIATAEKRLGVRLPPSYRAFLKVSNGWHYPNPFVARVAGTEEIGFLRDIQPELIAAWSEGGNLSDLPEKDLPHTLLINVPSQYDDGSNYMLNPVVVRDGEMEAWSFSDWNPGAAPQPSFWHLMASEVKNWKFMAAAQRQ